MKTKILPVLFLAFITLGCGGRRDSGDDSRLDGPAPNEGAGVSRSGASATEVIVTSDDASLPDGCDTRQIAELVIECANAFNRGDQERLSRLFFVSEGPSPRISLRKGTTRGRGTRCEVGEGGRIENGFVTHDQGELLRYFAERYGQGERLTLLKVSSTQAGLLEEEYNAGIVFVLTRDAEDIDPELGGPARIAFGKGAVNCESRRIFAWSMEMRAGDKRTPREAAGWLCSDPPGWRPGEAVIADA